MANTTSILSYANTFGDWVVQSNSLSKENNDLAANNYIKPTGTLYLNGLPLGLQVANNAVVGGQLQVQGIGSSAFIQNNLTVSTGQVYFSNTILGLTNAGQANIGGPLLALSTGNGLIVSNNAIVKGNTSIYGNASITGNTAIANNLVVTKNTTSNNIDVIYNSNTSTLTVFNDAYVNNDLNVSNKTLTYILQANTKVNTATLSVTGDSFMNVVQANTSVNTATLGVTGTGRLNIVQANTSVNTATLSVTGTGRLNIVQANTSVNTATLSVTGDSFMNVVQANTSVNTATLGVTGTGRLNIVQANTSVNTETLGVTGTGRLNIVQANTSVNTATLGVTGDSFMNVIQANTSVNTATMNTVSLNVTGPSFCNTLTAFGTIALLDDVTIGKDLTVSGDFIVNGNSILDTDTLTLKALAPLVVDNAGSMAQFVINRGEATNPVNANAEIRWSETNKYWDLRDVSSPLNYYRILTNQNLSDSISTANSTIVATAQAVKSLNDNLQSQITSNVSILSAAVTSSYSRANTSSNSFIGTTGSITPSAGVVTFASGNGVTAVGSGSTITINTAQDIRTSASPTFQALSLTSALPLIYGGTGATSSSGALANLLPGGATYGYVLTTGGAGSYSWSPQAGTSGVPPGTTINSARLSYTTTAGQTLFTTPTYIIGSGQLRVYVDGVRQYLSDYVETTTTSVTLNVGCALNDTVLVEVDGYIINPYYANNITYTSPQGGIVASANTIQLAITDLETRKAPLASPQLTGTPLSTTAAVGTNNTQIATTGFVYNVLGTASATYAHNISGSAGSVSTLTISSPLTGTSYNGSSAVSIGMAAASSGINGYMTGAYATKLDGIAAGATTNLGTVTSVGGTAPVSSSGGTTPVISMAAATAAVNGYLTAADWTTFNNKQSNLGFTPIQQGGAPGQTNNKIYIGWSAENVLTLRVDVTDYGNSWPMNISGVASGFTTTTQNSQFNSIGIGTAASATVGEIRATNNITAYYSDKRLKENITNISGALEKLKLINGVTYNSNDVAESFGYTDRSLQVGVIAQEIQEILPQAVKLAPFDTDYINGKEFSKSGDYYLTVQYERLIPLLIEAIKELSKEIDILKGNK
jgi:hypothetical protein